MSTCPTVRIKPSHPSQGEFVEINAEDFDPAKGHELVAAAPLGAPPAPLAPLAPPPGVADPLAGLPKDWQTKTSTADLKKLAAAASGGRTPENREQAVAMIAEKLAAK